MFIRRLLAAFCLMVAPSHLPIAHAEGTLIVGTGVDPSFTPLYVAFEQDLFRKNGIAAELKLFASGSAAVPSLISGDINISLGTPTAPLLNHMKANKIALAAQFARQYRYSELIGIKAIGAVSDLPGRRVGYELGTATEVFALEVLAEHKVAPETIRHVSLQPPEGLAALQRNDIDAVFTFKPWSDRMVAAMPDKVHRIPGTESFFSTQNVIMDKEWAEKNPKTATGFLDVLRQSIAFVRANPDEAAVLVGRHLRMDPGAVRPLLDLNDFELVLDNETIRITKREADLQVRTGRMPPGLSYAAFIYDAPLKRLDAARVNYALPN